MKPSLDVIKCLLRTEKTTRLEAGRKYFFRVSNNAGKIDIRRAVENIYKVKVSDVHTLRYAGKRRRVRQEFGYTSSWKKAIVTLHEGQKIEVS